MEVVRRSNGSSNKTKTILAGYYGSKFIDEMRQTRLLVCWDRSVVLWNVEGFIWFGFGTV